MISAKTHVIKLSEADLITPGRGKQALRAAFEPAGWGGGKDRSRVGEDFGDRGGAPPLKLILFYQTCKPACYTVWEAWVHWGSVVEHEIAMHGIYKTVLTHFNSGKN